MYGVFFPQRNSTVCLVCVGVYSLADLVHSLKRVVRCVWTQLLVNSSMKLLCTNSFTWTTDCAFPRLLSVFIASLVLRFLRVRIHTSFTVPFITFFIGLSAIFWYVLLYINYVILDVNPVSGLRY